MQSTMIAGNHSRTEALLVHIQEDRIRSPFWNNTHLLPASKLPAAFAVPPPPFLISSAASGRGARSMDSKSNYNCNKNKKNDQTETRSNLPYEANLGRAE